MDGVVVPGSGGGVPLPAGGVTLIPGSSITTAGGNVVALPDVPSQQGTSAESTAAAIPDLVVTCRVCQKAYAKYTCPRCFTRYCALSCYKAGGAVQVERS